MKNVSRLVLAASLKKRGHEVVAVENGRKAWEAFQQDYFHVLIADWLMPEMDGLALCREIRKLPRDNYTYLVLLTSLEGKTNYLEAMDAGADDFMTKPFDADQLTARIQVAERILGLHQHVSQLEGLLPIYCCSCKKDPLVTGRTIGSASKVTSRFIPKHGLPTASARSVTINGCVAISLPKKWQNDRPRAPASNCGSVPTI